MIMLHQHFDGPFNFEEKHSCFKSRAATSRICPYFSKYAGAGTDPVSGVQWPRSPHKAGQHLGGACTFAIKLPSVTRGLISIWLCGTQSDHPGRTVSLSGIVVLWRVLRSSKLFLVEDVPCYVQARRL